MMEIRVYTRDEVSKKNGRDGASTWIIIKDSVYDVTKYLSEHPGGDYILQEQAGKDATSAFYEMGHSSDAMFLLNKHKIGELVEEEKNYDANGKKKKKVKETHAEKYNRSCLNVCTCGLLG